MDTVAGGKESHDREIGGERELSKRKDRATYGSVSGDPVRTKFALSPETYRKFRDFFLSCPCELLYIKYGLLYGEYCLIKNNLSGDMGRSELFTPAEYDYSDMVWLLRRLITHVRILRTECMRGKKGENTDG